MERRGLSLIALALVIGICFGAYILGRSIEKFRTDDRYISVKGFAEREVMADFVIWSLKVGMPTNELQEGSKSLTASKNKVIEFLTKNGINRNEITQKELTVTDKQTREYGPVNSSPNLRYIIEETIEVRSTNVELVQKVSRMTSELLNVGVALSTKDDWRGTGLRFVFTKLNSIKPEMLSEATVNAKMAAEQFTKESSTTLGKMRKANQGLFSILDRDESLSGQTDGNAYASGSSDLFKKIRVVISVEYSIN